MQRVFFKRHPTVGSRPGTLVIPPSAQRPIITATEYSAAGATTITISDVAQLRPVTGPPSERTTAADSNASVPSGCATA